MRVRLDIKVALTRVTSSTPAALQIVVAVIASYAISHYLLGHTTPLLSITVVIAALGFGRDARPRRVFDTVVGILVGILFSELLFNWLGSGIWQIAVILLLTLLLARLISPSAAFAAAAGVQAMLVMLLPAPGGGVLTRSVDGLVGGIVALLVTALIPRDPRGIARRDARRLTSALSEALDALLAGLRQGDEPAASLSVERLRRTQTLVDDWTSSLDSAMSIARISPFLRRHLPDLRQQERVLRGMDLAARHLRVIARRVSFLVRDREVRPDMADLFAPIAAAIALLGESVEHPERRNEAAALLETLVVKLAPGIALPNAPVTESVIVLMIRPLVVDLLEASGRSADDARGLLPPV
jgi:uncharacterized membrane protein YgaE (UPF0421/DUF939 family)